MAVSLANWSGWLMRRLMLVVACLFEANLAQLFIHLLQSSMDHVLRFATFSVIQLFSYTVI